MTGHSGSNRPTGARRVLVFGGLALLVLAALAAAYFGLRRSFASGRGPEMRSLGSVRLGVETVPAAPTVGENRLRVRAESSDGKPLSGASIEGVVFMPAMGSMPYMESRPPLAEVRSGIYEGEFRIPMGGSWDVDLRLRSPNGQEARAALRLTVGTPGLTWVSESAGDSDTTRRSVAEGAIQLSARRRQEIGVTTARVERRDLSHTRRAVGRVVPDETRLVDVNLRFSGWVRRLNADFTGREVRAGEVLFTLYSPDLYTAEREYLEALEASRQLTEPAARARAVELADAARRRLLLWGVSPTEVAELERLRAASDERAVRSPASGVVLEKAMVEGAKVEAGTMVYRIAPLDPIWVLADVYQYELPLLGVGRRAEVRLPYGDAPPVAGRVTYLYPVLEGESRTASVRIEVPNPGLRLKPEMFVDVLLEVPLGMNLAVPQSAVLVSGERHLVFVDRGDGWLEPRTVEIGPRAGDFYAVRGGLAEGDIVVTSGNFLLSAESRLRAATSRFGEEDRP